MGLEELSKISARQVRTISQQIQRSDTNPRPFSASIVPFSPHFCDEKWLKHEQIRELQDQRPFQQLSRERVPPIVVHDVEVAQRAVDQIKADI